MDKTHDTGNHSGIEMIDPLPTIRQFEESGILLYGVVDRHMNARGHEELAKYLLPIVEASLVGKSK